VERHTAPTGLRSGVLLTIPHDGGPVVQSDTVQCCHCGATWVFAPGSGRRRGRCGPCGGLTCGPLCPARGSCVPMEQMLDNWEHGRPDDFRPTVVSTAGLVLP
jgi:hypothetical protein